MPREMALVYGRNAELAEQLRRTVQRADYQVRTTRDEARFWETYLAEGADLVLVDFPDSRTPGECRETLQRLQAANPRVRIVLLVGSYAEARTCLEADDLSNPLVEVVMRPLRRGELALRMARLKRYGEGLSAQWVAGDSFESMRVSADHVVPGLHDLKSGRIDARKVSEFFGLSLADLGRLVGRSRAALHKTSAAPGNQKKLAPLASIASSLLRLVGSPEAARIWLNSPNPELEGTTPMSVVRDDGAETVDELLEVLALFVGALGKRSSVGRRAVFTPGSCRFHWIFQAPEGACGRIPPQDRCAGRCGGFVVPGEPTSHPAA